MGYWVGLNKCSKTLLNWLHLIFIYTQVNKNNRSYL